MVRKTKTPVQGKGDPEVAYEDPFVKSAKELADELAEEAVQEEATKMLEYCEIDPIDDQMTCNAVITKWKAGSHLGTTRMIQAYSMYKASGFDESDHTILVEDDICYTTLRIREDSYGRRVKEVDLLLGNYELDRLIAVLIRARKHRRVQQIAWEASGSAYNDGKNNMLKDGSWFTQINERDFEVDYTKRYIEAVSKDGDA